MEYKTGFVKRNAESGEVALRTGFPDEPAFSRLAWLVSTTGAGPRNAPTSEVEEWADLFDPDA